MKNSLLRTNTDLFIVSCCWLPIPGTAYPEDAPKFLHRDDLAAQCRRLASTFDLNVWTKTTVKSTTQDATTKQWNIVLQTPHGERVVHAKQLVQATGVGSRFPYVPKLDNEKTVYEGVSIHSQDFKNGNLLKERGVKVRDCLTESCVQSSGIDRSVTSVRSLSSSSDQPILLSTY